MQLHGFGTFLIDPEVLIACMHCATCQPGKQHHHGQCKRCWAGQVQQANGRHILMGYALAGSLPLKKQSLIISNSGFW
jgi:hypothetical protein